MSRPPAPAVNYSYSTPSSPAMADTQSAPSFPPPAYLEYSHRRLPQPIQLPPLSIPQQHSPRSDYQGSPPPNHPLPSIHAAPAPPSRSQPRSYSGPAAPLDKLLSPHPYTPPRSDPAYSPQRSPPRSIIEGRLPPRRSNEAYQPEEQRLDPRHDQRHDQRHEQRYEQRHEQRHEQRQDPRQDPRYDQRYDQRHDPRHDQRHYAQEPVYVSPVETHRQSYSTLPSPASSYAPSFPPSSHYRPAIPTPHIPTGTRYGSPAYSEPAPAPPPHSVPAAAPPQGPVSQKSELKYELRVRQQPIAARACGFGERDRRVIDPPPIIQLLVRDPKTGIVDLDELRYSSNVVHCTLWNADGTNEETALVQPDRRTTRRLMGQLVASPSVAKDEHDVEGCFFCFPDLSCRTHGKYRLRFVLMRIDPTDLVVGGFSPILTEVLSDVFTVYTAKDFPGMRPSSALTRALKLQGCNIQVKKGNEKALARKRVSPSSEEDAEDGGGKGGKRQRKD